ncbi:MAG: hypothetical protein PUH53_06230 [Mycoplasma sp.]|nr:hypothetical protein [Mycoplasma sp.]
MDAKNKSNIKLLSIVASVMLLIIVLGASFAYFGTYKENIDKYKINITIDEFAKATFVTKDANLNLSVSKKDMVAYEAGTKAAENSANLNVVLTSGNPNVKVTCTYDIYYEYDANSSIYGVSPTPVTDSSLKELTLKAVGSTGANNYANEKNFNYDTSWTTNPYKRLIVKGASITDATKNGTTDTWNFNMAFYNLDADQNKLAGKTFAGTFYVDKDSIQCDYQNNDGGGSVSGTSFETLMTPNNTDIFNEKGIRYEGADPKNYICLDSNKEGACSSSSLLFRIIGLFEEEYFSDGTSSTDSKKLLKVIDTNNYGGTSGKVWNSAGTNNWSTASLKTELNGTYLSTLLATSGVNSKLNDVIVKAKWHLGGANNTSGSNYYIQKITTENYYKAEGSPYATSGTLQNLYSGNPEYVYAKVGLMYPSDYGYATVGGSTTNKSSCRENELYNWDSSSYSDCKNNDWLFTSQNNFVDSSEWFISPDASNVNVNVKV